MLLASRSLLRSSSFSSSSSVCRFASVSTGRLSCSSSSRRHNDDGLFVRNFSSSVKARFAPHSILPHAFKDVRIIGNTSRDAQQSNLSAEMAHEHRVEVAKRVDAVYKDMTSPKRGYEQIWGGTVPMFDIWKRGVQPFDSIRAQVAFMPNTPSSALIRGQALVGMGSQSNDVVDSFIKCAVAAGVDVYTTFDAHNDARNQRAVAEAVLKYGGHYQGSLSYAVYAADPTIYNVGWAVNFFRELVNMGAHSLYLKDPSGVLTPEMSRAICTEVKSAFPHLPLVVHTHYQTGYAYMTYLEAAKAGANGLECSFGFADGAGQPYGLTMIRTLEDFGFQTGNMNKEAIANVDAYCKTIRPLYSQCVIRTPDLAVEQNGIAGGQRTILDKELIDANQTHLIPKVELTVAQVRAKGGKICQVTPVADAYAREAMRRLRGGAADKNFAPGYASMLKGEWGYLKEPVSEQEQAQALLEKGEQTLKQAASQGLFTNELASQLLAANSAHLHTIRKQSKFICDYVVLARRKLELQQRLQEVQFCSSKPELAERLELKIAQAGEKDEQGQPITTLARRVHLIQADITAIDKEVATRPPRRFSDQEYETLYLGKMENAVYEKLLKEASPPLPVSLTVAQYKQLFASLSFISGSPANTLTSAMEAARTWLAKFDEEHVVGLTSEGDRLKEESEVLVAIFGKSVVPNMLENFFLNYRENPAFWPPTYKADRPASTTKKSASEASDFLHLGQHTEIEQIVGATLLSELIERKQQLNKWSARNARALKGDLVNVLGSLTKQKMQQRVDHLTKLYEQQRVLALNELKKVVASRPPTRLPTVTPLLELKWNPVALNNAEQKFVRALDSYVAAKAAL